MKKKEAVNFKETVKIFWESVEGRKRMKKFCNKIIISKIK